MDIPYPAEIKQYLDSYIIGQDEAKRIISVAAYYHYKRVNGIILDDDSMELEKSNILICGPTGVGKTALIKCLGKLLHKPVAVCDCSSFTQNSYRGRDLDTMFNDLFALTDDKEEAQQGILFLDEFDKMASVIFESGEFNVNGAAVQREILKYIEGTTLTIRCGEVEELFDTSNILFICGGAFEGIEPIIEKRLYSAANVAATIGFGALNSSSGKHPRATSNLQMKVSVEDFMKYGLIPELLGRLPVICPLNELTIPDLVRILTEPHNAIVRQYKRLLSGENAKLTIQQEALTAIATEANRRHLGARGLRSIMERILNKMMFTIPQIPYPVEIIVTQACVEKGIEPVVKRISNNNLLYEARLERI